MYILNGRVYENQEETISPTSQAMMFGYGLFETLKVLNGKILFFDEHFERLKSGCKTLKLSLHTEKLEIKRDCYKLLKLKNVENGVLKVLYAKNNNRNYLLLTTRENPYTEQDYLKGFKLTFSEQKRNQHSILTFIKSNNYMENILVKEDALELGFDEVIFTNTDNHLAEGAASNIFWIKNQVIHTPSIECGLLPGIVREKVLISLERLGLEVKVGKFNRENIMDSEEVFITNSLMDIMPVCKIEKVQFKIGQNTITEKIICEYNRLIGEEDE